MKSTFPLCTGFESPLGLSRRQALQTFGMGLGSIALADLLAAEATPQGSGHPPAKAKRVIYLFQAGGPSQIDLYDWKPKLVEDRGKELPDSIRKGQRLTAMSGNQASLPLVGSPFKFEQHGRSGRWMNSDLLPHTSKIADDLCMIKSMNTEAINMAPGSPSCRPAPNSRAVPAWARGSTTGSAPSTRTFPPSTRSHRPTRA